MESVCGSWSGLSRGLAAVRFPGSLVGSGGWGRARARSAAELQESARLVSPCPGVLSAFCKQGVRWHAKNRTPRKAQSLAQAARLRRGPGEKAKATLGLVSRMLLGLLGSLLGDLPGLLLKLICCWL